VAEGQPHACCGVVTVPRVNIGRAQTGPTAEGIVLAVSALVIPCGAIGHWALGAVI